MNEEIKLGLVIQGPITSYGAVSGPNSTKIGYDSVADIIENIKAFTPLVDHIVVSTWYGSGLEDEKNSNFTLIENQVPKEYDFDNRRKQFFSTYQGVKYLSENTDVTHVIKIRTDQVISPSLAIWVKNFYLKHSENFSDDQINQRQHIIFSEYLDDNLFYVGDFIFAGSLYDIFNLCRISINYKNNLHTQINADFIIKYLSITDQNFKNVFFKYLPYTYQTSNLNDEVMVQYWLNILKQRFSFMPKSMYGEIKWRGRMMPNVIPCYDVYLKHYENWACVTVSDRPVKQTKSIVRILPNKNRMKKLLYEYKHNIYKHFKYSIKNIMKPRQ